MSRPEAPRPRGAAHRVQGGGAGRRWGAAGCDVHHQCQHGAAAGGPSVAPHLHQQHERAGLSQAVGDIGENVSLLPKAPVLITCIGGSAQRLSCAEETSRSAWLLLTSDNGVGQRGALRVPAAHQAGDGLPAACASCDPQLLHLRVAQRCPLRHGLPGAEVAQLHPAGSLWVPPAQSRPRCSCRDAAQRLHCWHPGVTRTPAGARPHHTGGSAGSPGPRHCGCLSAAPSAGSQHAAGGRGAPPHGSHLRGRVSCQAPVGARAVGQGKGWALTGACINGEGLCRAGAPLQAVLEAVRWVVTVSADHAPHNAAKRCCLRHSEDDAIGALRCEFIDG